VQDKDDSVNCGVLGTKTISCWCCGREAETQVGDPIKFRREFVAQMSRRLKDGMVSNISVNMPNGHVIDSDDDQPIAVRRKRRSGPQRDSQSNDRVTTPLYRSSKRMRFS
jgi:hypothetical protein